MSQPEGTRSRRGLALWVGLALLVSGCTPWGEYVRNGFKVGPNYHEPPAPVARNWIDAADPHFVHVPADEGDWWTAFNDPALNSLIETATRENLDLKTAVTRIFQAQAQRNIAAGNLLPQTQNATVGYAHGQISKNFNIFSPSPFGLPTNLNVWSAGFNASWELDFWGRLRRNVESANDQLDASVEGYREAMVILLADVATNYVQLRTFQQRLAFAYQNVQIQQGSLKLVQSRLDAGKASQLDLEQALSVLAQTEASIPPLEIGQRQANDRLCELLGRPPENLLTCLDAAQIPEAPARLAVGIPADLLRRRPDVRQAEREAAAQAAQIGVAVADFYPRFGVIGTIGYASDDIRRLFDESSFTGIIVPNFQWKILNYGRVLNGVRLQDARFRDKVFTYQKTVLAAGREVEDALVGFVQYQAQRRSLEKNVRAAERSVELVLEQFRRGATDFNRVFTTQSQLVTQQDQLAVTRGNIALSLIAVYRAMGGGWQALEIGATRAGCVIATGPPAVGLGFRAEDDATAGVPASSATFTSSVHASPTRDLSQKRAQ
jgi:NodT family efflux transporter outer membrane factor (OMF) lipoprotein